MLNNTITKTIDLTEQITEKAISLNQKVNKNSIIEQDYILLNSKITELLNSLEKNETPQSSIPSDGPFGSDILVKNGTYYFDTATSVVYDFSGTYKLQSGDGFEKIWKHETESYYIFYCNQSYSNQWRFTTKEPDGWDSAMDFLITDATDKWPWEAEFHFNNSYNGNIPTITAGPEAGD